MKDREPVCLWSWRYAVVYTGCFLKETKITINFVFNPVYPVPFSICFLAILCSLNYVWGCLVRGAFLAFLEVSQSWSGLEAQREVENGTQNTLYLLAMWRDLYPKYLNSLLQEFVHQQNQTDVNQKYDFVLIDIRTQAVGWFESSDKVSPGHHPFTNSSCWRPSVLPIFSGLFDPHWLFHRCCLSINKEGG